LLRLPRRLKKDADPAIREALVASLRSIARK
jgi:hypothetical protein